MTKAPRPRRQSRARRRRALVVLLLALLVAAALAALRKHSGLAAALGYQLLDAGLRESWNNYRFVAYVAESLEGLSFNPETGQYDFEQARREPAGPAESGRLAYHVGDFASAVASFERAIEEQGASDKLLFWLANSHLRQAEADNCLATLLAEGSSGSELVSPQPMCSLPLKRFHQRAESSRAAAALFERLLERRPNDRLSRWLLNFSIMTLGAYPEDVPPRHRIESPFIDSFFGAAAERAAARHADLLLVDRAAALGVDTFDAGKGVAVEDFDRDGDLDIVTGGNFDPLRYYRNESGRAFVERAAAAGLAGITQVHIITAADFDGDGWVDLFVGRPFLPFVLMRNDRQGGFRDVTSPAGLLDGWLEGEVSFTWASAWGDVDRDGDLDLFIARWGLRVPFQRKGPLARPYRGSRFFSNHRGRFLDATRDFGLTRAVRDQGIIGAAFGDHDNDGYPDLFLSGIAQRQSRLLRNQAGERFVAVSRHGPGFMTAFVDVDHDGQLEIFHAGFTDARTSTEETVFGRKIARRAGRTVLLRRGADGAYRADTDFFASAALPAPTMGASYGDLDHDGCHDFYLGTGNPENWTVLPNLMFRGQPNGSGCADRAVDVSMLNGFGNLQKGHGIVFFDFDDDGDQDVYSSLGGMWPGDRWPNQLFVNDSPIDNRWIKIRLRGRQMNTHGLGARILVRAQGAGGQDVERTYVMDHKTGFGGAPYLADIGLAGATAVRQVEVLWPASGCRSIYPARLDSLVWLYESRCSPLDSSPREPALPRS